MSQACEQYAGYINDAHHQASHELSSLLKWMAGIEIAGAVISVISFGAAEVVAQSTVLERITATGGAIAAIIDRLAILTRDAVEAVSALPGRVAGITRSLNPLATARRIVAITDTVEATRAEQTAAIVLDRMAIEASVDLTKVPTKARAAVLDALERARTGKVRFQIHDGKTYLNRKGALPNRSDYAEWTSASSGSRRGVDRVITAGDPANPEAVYYWDHTNPPILIGPTG
jgi:guanyl-specific ribonuclease Sa